MASPPPTTDPPHAPPIRAVETACVCAYTQHTVFFMVWRDAPTDDAIDAVHDALRAFAQRLPGGVSVMSLIERGARPPSPQHRARIIQFQEALGDRLKRVVLHVDGMGFVASMLLAAATSFTVGRRPRFQQDVMRTPEAAAERLLLDLHVATRFSRASLVEAIAFVRADAARLTSGGKGGGSSG